MKRSCGIDAVPLTPMTREIWDHGAGLGGDGCRGVRVERCREFGGPWLGLQLLRKVGLDEFFAKSIPSGRPEAPWPMMAAVPTAAKRRKPCMTASRNASKTD